MRNEKKTTHIICCRADFHIHNIRTDKYGYSDDLLPGLYIINGVKTLVERK